MCLLVSGLGACGKGVPIMSTKHISFAGVVSIALITHRHRWSDLLGIMLQNLFGISDRARCDENMPVPPACRLVFFDFPTKYEIVAFRAAWKSACSESSSTHAWPEQ